MKHVAVVSLILLCLGCSSSTAPAEKLVAKVGPATITQHEFEDAYKTSVYSQQSSLTARNDFLKVLINRKLILLDAEKRGLDQRQDFLAMIQNFWEQSLLTMALNEKSKELSSVDGDVSPVEIQEAYDMMVKEGRTVKPLNDSYPQIQEMVKKKHETERFNQWINGLQKNTNVETYQENL